MNLYKEIVKAKDENLIPLFQNGRSMHSLYSPIKEAESFGEKNNKSNYVIILGLGGGYHIKSYAKNNPDSFILVIEESKEEIDFLKKIPCINELFNNSKIKIIPKSELYKTLLLTYLPGVYGNILILPHRAWFESNKESANQIIELINQSLKEISKDYSVQCHFGFIWQKNIMENLKVLSSIDFNEIRIDNTKIAAIIAAGPTLDSTIKHIQNNPNKYFIIATDTALSVLHKKKIKTDAVISIDGQNISYKHFVGTCSSQTIFVFDLQSNFNAVNYAKKISKKIVFVKSGHPLCQYAESFCNNSTFINITAGSGTVTIAAVDFSKKIGFSNIEVFGADFSYVNNKPYAKGTYLDTLYRANENKIIPAENHFVNLLFRTSVIHQSSIIFTEILNSYKQTFIEWIKKNSLSFNYEDNIYKIQNEKNDYSINKISKINFNYKTFLQDININAKKIIANLEENNFYLNNPLIISLLPYISFLRTKDTNLDYKNAVKLALQKLLEYNKFYE